MENIFIGYNEHFWIVFWVMLKNQTMAENLHYFTSEYCIRMIAIVLLDCKAGVPLAAMRCESCSFSDSPPLLVTSLPYSVAAYSTVAMQ